MLAPAHLRDLVSDYFQNRAKYVDFDTLSHYDNNQYLVKIKPLGEVLGLDVLGSGHFSTALDLGDGKVLKVVCNQESDVSYSKFVEFCKTDRSGYFPKIFYSGNWGGRDVYILERLTKMPDFDANLASTFVGNTFSTIQRISWAKKNNGRDRWGDIIHNVTPPEPSDFVPCLDQGLIAAIERLHDYFHTSKEQGSSLNWDMHGGNVMLRNGQIVITDPFS